MGITEIATLIGEIGVLIGVITPVIVSIQKISNAEALTSISLFEPWSGKIYRCTRDDSNGQGTILHYVPSQLVGIYFEELS